jgi:flagellar biosynthesis/type III secretory pathway protein FliH
MSNDYIFTQFRKPQKTARLMVAMTKRQHEKLTEAAEAVGLCKADYLVAAACAQWDEAEPDEAKRTWYGGETAAEREAREEARRQAAEEAVRRHLAALGVA